MSPYKYLTIFRFLDVSKLYTISLQIYYIVIIQIEMVALFLEYIIYQLSRPVIRPVMWLYIYCWVKYEHD